MPAIWGGVIAAGGSIAGGMLAKGGRGGGPDLQAIAVNNQATVSSGSLLQQYQSYRALEPLMPQLLTYAGYSPEQITQTITTQRQALGSTLAAEAQRQRGSAWGANAYTGLESAAHALGFANTPLGPGGGDPFPDMRNLPTLVKPLDPNLDYHQPGGGKFVFTPTENSPQYLYEQELGTRNLNRQLSARGLFNSGAGLEAYDRFNNQLVAEETGRQLAQQNMEYGYAVASNAAQRGQQQATFGNLLAATGLDQNFALAQQQQGNALQMAGLQAQTSLANTQAQVGLGQYQTGAQLTSNMFAGVNNAIQSGIGTYYNQQNADRTYNLLNNFYNPAGVPFNQQ